MKKKAPKLAKAKAVAVRTKAAAAKAVKAKPAKAHVHDAHTQLNYPPILTGQAPVRLRVMPEPPWQALPSSNCS